MSYTPLPLCVLRKPIQPEHIRKGQLTLPGIAYQDPNRTYGQGDAATGLGLFGKTTVKHKKHGRKLPLTGNPHPYLPLNKIFIAAAIYSPTPTKMQYHQHHRA